MKNLIVTADSIASNNITEAMEELRLREQVLEADKAHPGLIEAIATHIVMLDTDFEYEKEFPVKFWVMEGR